MDKGFEGRRRCSIGYEDEWVGALFMAAVFEFESHDSYVVVCLAKAIYGNFSCSVALLVVEMQYASNPGYSKAGLNAMF